MDKAKIISAVSLGALLLGIVPALAQTGTTTPPTNSAAIACLAAAVSTREKALGAGVGTYTGAINAAYTARASALASAYAQTGGNTAIRTAVRAAWSAFNKSMRSARQTWNSTRLSAWSQFRTAAKACRAPSSVSDSANAASEVSGQ
ncbi:MAG: hypothetical protein HY220_02335 [Candidatus Sungbacteria bacterium]|uniref:Uncharacterized protein n=1 Tax=Candidatus Sungiibacteriota bacterium TaxID=2750080 RepID=A0A9D6QTW1_9BACT|nr:hypothetical protein [Candidatus Sungbacteria bacterium]